MSLRRGVSERRACRVLGQHRSTSAMSLGAVTTKSTWSHGSWGLPGTKTANGRVCTESVTACRLYDDLGRESDSRGEGSRAWRDEDQGSTETARRRNRTRGPRPATRPSCGPWPALRGSMDAAEYNHVVLGLIFLKYISDAFKKERHATVLVDFGKDTAEDRDEYTAENIFWVPPEVRRAHLKRQARQSWIGVIVDGAMAAIERDNPALREVLPRDYALPALDKRRLGQLIDVISNIQATRTLVLGTCSAVSTSTSSRSSRARRARRAAGSPRRAASSRCWSRCWSRTAAGSTTRAAARPACSCSPSSSSTPTPAGIQTRQSAQRHQHLRPGIELHDVATSGVSLEHVDTSSFRAHDTADSHPTSQKTAGVAGLSATASAVKSF